MFYYTGDQHFFHAGILKHTDRKFDTVEEMNEEIVRRHNETVRRETDQVFILGDVAHKAVPRHLFKLLPRLRGRLKLLYGNHDRAMLMKASNKGALDDLCRRGKVQLLGDLYEQKITLKDDEKIRLVLCHYPLQHWNCQAYGAIHLHGHSHGHCRPELPRRVDVGVDCWDLRPASLDEILGVVRLRQASQALPKMVKDSIHMAAMGQANVN